MTPWDGIEDVPTMCEVCPYDEKEIKEELEGVCPFTEEDCTRIEWVDEDEV